MWHVLAGYGRGIFLVFWNKPEGIFFTLGLWGSFYSYVCRYKNKWIISLSHSCLNSHVHTNYGLTFYLSSNNSYKSFSLLCAHIAKASLSPYICDGNETFWEGCLMEGYVTLLLEADHITKLIQSCFLGNLNRMIRGTWCLTFHVMSRRQISYWDRKEFSSPWAHGKLPPTH